MKDKYDKYWDNLDNMNVLLYVALVLDPRNKLKYLEFCLDLIYPKSRTSTETYNQGDQVLKRLKTLSAKTIKICNIVEDAFNELYLHYKIKLDKHNDQTFTVSSSSTPIEDDISMKIDLYDGFSKYLETQYGEGDGLIEVDVYLQDGAEKRGDNSFDVLDLQDMPINGLPLEEMVENLEKLELGFKEVFMDVMEFVVGVEYMQDCKEHGS
ncbi:zinc finger BED domain-containing protein RICESLEEPER 2-like protein [Tanacetum coccineum]